MQTHLYMSTQYTSLQHPASTSVFLRPPPLAMGVYHVHSSGSPLAGVEASTLRCRHRNGQETAVTYDEERNQVQCKSMDDGSAAASRIDSDCDLYYGSELVCKDAECSHSKQHRNISQATEGSSRPLPPPNTTTIASSHGSVIQSLSFVDRFLSVWIIIVMVLGVVVGYYSPAAQKALNAIQITTVSLPVAMGLWFMMYPVLVKVRYESFGAIFRRRETYRQMLFSVAANWVIGPFIMLAVAWATLPDLDHYRNGVIMVGLARCIAMVLIWNQLAQGDAEYCAILVALNSILQIILYAPLALFFLVVISRQYTGSGQSFNLNYWLVFRSVLLFLGVPLAAAVITRFSVIAVAGREWMEKKFAPVIGPVALLALLWTVFVIFAIQGHNIIDNIGDVCRVAVPMVLYFIIMFTTSLLLCRWFNFGYEKAVTQAFTASSNNFELAIAVAAATFGVDSPEALAATIGPLVEVPVLLGLVYVALWLKPRISWQRGATAAAAADRDGPPAGLLNQPGSTDAVELTRCK